MDEAKTARAEAIFASDEMAKAKFVNSRPIARKPRVYGRNDSLGWKPVGSNDARIPFANIKSGIVELQIKTALMKARRFIKLDD